MPFVKGKSGNPKGRPTSEESIAPLIRGMLENRGDDGKAVREQLIFKLIEMANKGNIHAIKTLLSYGYGMPSQTVSVDGNMTTEHFLYNISDAVSLKPPEDTELNKLPPPRPTGEGDSGQQPIQDA